MAIATLGAQTRTDTGKGAARKLRAAGNIPGIIYGHGREPQALTVSAREFDRLAERVRITSTVIELELDGKTSRTLVRELQRDPIKRHVLHVDFQELVAGETVTVNVPLRFVGTADGVRNSGGILEEIVHQIEVECDPANIPDHIDVDVTSLTIGHSLHVADIKLPEGVQATDDPEITIAVVSAPKTEAEPVAAEAAPAEAAAEPELIRKPKGEDEGEDKEG